MQIQILRGEERFGPYSEEEAQRYLQEGSLLPSDLGWHEGITEWTTLETLFPPQTARSAPPPPPSRLSALRAATKARHAEMPPPSTFHGRITVPPPVIPGARGAMPPPSAFRGPITKPPPVNSNRAKPNITATVLDLSSVIRFFALYRREIGFAALGVTAIVAFLFARPWLGNEVLNRVPAAEQFSAYIRPAAVHRFSVPNSVQFEVTTGPIKWTGRGKAEAQVMVSATAKEDLYMPLDILTEAYKKGFDSQAYNDAVREAHQLSANVAPSVPDNPHFKYVRLSTPSGTRREHTFMVQAIRRGASWTFSLSPPDTDFSALADFDGEPPSEIGDILVAENTPEAEKQLNDFMDSRREYVAAVAKAKAQYEQTLADDAKQKLEAEAAAAAKAAEDEKIAAAENHPVSDTNSTAGNVPRDPKTQLPLSAAVRGTVVLRLKSQSPDHPDALLIDSDVARAGAGGLLGSVMLVDDPNAKNAAVGDGVDLPAHFLGTVQFSQSNSKPATIAQ